MRSKSLIAFVGIVVVLAMLLVGVACSGTGQSASGAGGSGEPASLAPGKPGDQGVFDDRVLFGQSAAFSGPAQHLGQDMRSGILAAFNEANEAGGVHGRRLELESLDDGYESDVAFSNTQQLLYEREVFALIGAVGTPTSRAAFLSASAAGAPFLAPFTGAEFLRDPELDNIVNLRASYYQETEEMVERLTEDLGLTRIAVFYQNDSFGQAGLAGTIQALQRRGLEPAGSGYYERNTGAVTGAVFHILDADPEAIIMVGAYVPVAKTVQAVREQIDPVFMAISFVGSKALAEELGPDGAGIYVTQVVPSPDDASIAVVAKYQAALADSGLEATPSFVSLEGYLAGRLAIAGLDGCGRDLTRDCFLNVIRGKQSVDIDGFMLQYGPEDNQGSNAVFVTVLGEDGKYRPVDRLEIGR
ncbi:MAG: ABC transporter substrate-binding protein [Chloroflexota bacterium]|nr:ABC transporter substrate-binding protein [Chloroflexota bacterium]MDE2961852.1 ABC transporter substrate-binding protein [Chloroflexota bacterium]